MLEELQDVCVMEHCLDIIRWLEQNRAWLESPGCAAGINQVGVLEYAGGRGSFFTIFFDFFCQERKVRNGECSSWHVTCPVVF